MRSGVNRWLLGLWLATVVLLILAVGYAMEMQAQRDSLSAWVAEIRRTAQADTDALLQCRSQLAETYTFGRWPMGEQR